MCRKQLGIFEFILSVNFMYLVFSTICILMSFAPMALASNFECIQFYGQQGYHHRSTDLGQYPTHSVATLFRAQMVREHLHEDVTTPFDRANFLRHQADTPNQNRVVIEFENSELKFLNDFLNDKDLITSIDNFANSYILNQIKSWIYGQSDFGVSIKVYSDGKSLTVIIDTPRKITENDLERVDAIFEKFQANLSVLLKEKKMFRDSDKIEKWFRMGVGRTPDEAYFSARVSRKLAGPNQVKHYSNSLIQKKLHNMLFHAEDRRAKLATSADLATLMIQEPNSGKLVPSQALFEILRKASDGEAIRRAVKENFKIEISIESADNLSLYAEIIDLLNPKFFVVDQSVVTLAQATNGGVVIDRKGMGAANQLAAAKAAARARNATEFLHYNRMEERKVTDEINIYRREMETQWGAKCRGDDCVIDDVSKIDMRSFLNNPLIKGQRVVFVPPGIADSHSRSEMSTHGEAIEKLFIKNLVKVVTREEFRNLTFAIDFKTVAMSTGAIDLLVNPLNGSVPPNVRQHIRDSFQKSIVEFNAERAKQKKSSSYQPAQIVEI